MNNDDLVKAFIASKTANTLAHKQHAETRHTDIVKMCDKYRPHFNKLIKFLETLKGKVTVYNKGTLAIGKSYIELYDTHGVCFNTDNFDNPANVYSERFGVLTNYYIFISSYYDDKKDVDKYISDVYSYVREYLLQQIKEYDEDTASVL